VDGSAPISYISSPANGYIVHGNSVVISGTATDGIGDYAGIGVKYVKLSKNGGGVWDTVYTAASQVQSIVNWNWNYTDLTPGNYTISVKAIDWLDNEELTTSSISITVVATTPTADFTATPTTGVAPLSVEFLDTSSPGSWPIASWSWHFGDGSAVSTLQNPTHVYTSRGVFTVSLTVSDAYNTSNTITMTDMINVTNQAPVVMLPLPDFERNEDFTPIVIDLSNHFQDGDGDVLSYSVAVDPTLVNATITNNSLTIISTTNTFGSVNVTVEASDQYPPLALVRNGASKNRATCTDSFVLLINPVNDAPAINLPASFTFAEDGNLVVDMAPYVSDVDSPSLTITAQNGAHVSVEMNGLNATLTAAANWNGTETVGFTVSDGALTATGQTNVIVLPVNDPPALDLPASFTFAEDENLTIDLALYASDIDNSNLTLTVSGNVNVTVGIVGLEVTLGALLNWSGTEQLVFTVSDNMSRALASDSTNIIVSPVNDAPIISSFSPEDTTLTLQLNDTQSFSVIAVDVDNDISYSWFINDVNQSVSLNTFEYQFTQSSTHVVKVVVTDGIASVEQTWTVSVPVANDDPSVTPFVTKLYPNYPNPFNPETTIQYSLEAPGWVDISIYNIGGQLIRELKRGNENSGRHSLIWNGRDNDDNAVATGLYYVRMRTNNNTSIIKMTLMK
jgi:PKD repeat protein